MLKVEVRKVDKAYTPKQPVLQQFDLTVMPGELFFLLGPSGCGKTTLLRLLAGFLRPDRGTIRFDDRDVTAAPPERREAGLVFQNYALWPHMSVFDNVAFGLDTRGIRGDSRRRQVMAALETVEMTAFADRKPASLSGGQQQRVALARALAFQPRLLLLDEPLSNLDAKLRDTMRQEIRRICKDAGLTAIYVTHDRKEALTMADRIAILNRGRLEQLGTPEELYRRPRNRFTAEFMGPANFFPVTITAVTENSCTLTTPFGPLTARLPAFPVGPGQTLTAMVRTEALRFVAADDKTGNNVFSGCLAAESYQGENSVWDLAAADRLLHVLESCPPRRTLGDKVRLTIAPEYPVLLEEK
ncbi:MAG: ABC transporter ATP-binding protein [Victivallales bacterium]|nr:ABC transporter ATP-binding protein [Victivallales bacterium]